MNKSLVTSIIGFICLFLSLTARGQETVIASYYSDYLKGFKMANGDRYNPNELTCAHLTYPLGTILKVARKDDPNQSVMVTVVDRGPYIKGRSIDLSKQAAHAICMIEQGLVEVVIAVVKKPKTQPMVGDMTKALAAD